MLLKLKDKESGLGHTSNSVIYLFIICLVHIQHQSVSDYHTHSPLTLREQRKPIRPPCYVMTVGSFLLVNSVNLLNSKATSIKGFSPSAAGLGYSSGLFEYFSTYILMVAP